MRWTSSKWPLLLTVRCDDCCGAGSRSGRRAERDDTLTLAERQAAQEQEREAGSWLTGGDLWRGNDKVVTVMCCRCNNLWIYGRSTMQGGVERLTSLFPFSILELNCLTFWWQVIVVRFEMLEIVTPHWFAISSSQYVYFLSESNCMNSLEG